jgi:hypothetical protein
MTAPTGSTALRIVAGLKPRLDAATATLTRERIETDRAAHDLARRADELRAKAGETKPANPTAE